MLDLPEGFVARPATLDDVPITVELVNACSIELIGRPECEEHQFRNDWQSPNMHLETDMWLVFADDGTLVGYAGVWDADPHVSLFGWGHVHPDHKGRGIGTTLAGWVEGRALQAIPKAPSGTRVTLQQSKLATDTAAGALLRAQGYAVTRYFSRMLIEMDAPPPPPVLPESIAVRTFHRDRQLVDLVHAERDIFKDHWGHVEGPFDKEFEDWSHWIDHDPDFDPSLWFLAMAGDEIAGVALCQPKTAEDPDMGYVDSLGVRRPWRRKGIALAMLHHAFGEFYRRGRTKVALDVDAESLTGATRLYERAGMHVQRQSVNYEKELRPGQDLSTQSISSEPDDQS